MKLHAFSGELPDKQVSRTQQLIAFFKVKRIHEEGQEVFQSEIIIWIFPVQSPKELREGVSGIDRFILIQVTVWVVIDQLYNPIVWNWILFQQSLCNKAGCLLQGPIIGPKTWSTSFLQS